jgi:hypothetical protein
MLMRDAWQRLVNDLVAAGHEVVPSDGRLPEEAADAADAVRAGMARAAMIIHLIGEREEPARAGSSETLVDLQIRLSREHNAGSKPIPTIFWAPKWLPDHAAGKRDPFQVLARFGAVRAGEHVYGEEVTDLSQWLRSRLQPDGARQARQISLCVVAASAEDDGYVNQLANRLQASDIRVRPTYAGEFPAGRPSEDIALVVWGAAAGGAIRKIVDDLTAAGRRVFVLRLPGGDQQAKSIFFVAGVIAEDLPALPSDRRTARQLLEQLEIVQSPGGPTQ